MAAAIKAALPKVNVYPNVTTVLSPPGVVIRPDFPWMGAPEGFHWETHRYQAAAFVSANDTASATLALFDMVAAIREAAGSVDGLTFIEVGGIAHDRDNGVLVAPVRFSIPQEVPE